jgi:hypothetical protein
MSAERERVTVVPDPAQVAAYRRLLARLFGPRVSDAADHDASVPDRPRHDASAPRGAEDAESEAG